MKILLFLLTLSLLGCASKKSDESSVRVLTTTETSEKCKEVKKITISGTAAATEEEREEKLREETSSAGGDMVVITKKDVNNTIHGTAYKCD
jgi:hypothetical protein